MEKWQAELLRSGDAVKLNVDPATVTPEQKLPDGKTIPERIEGGLLPRGGEVPATVVRVGRTSLRVRVEGEYDIPLTAISSVTRRDHHHDALQDIVPSHVETIYPDDPRYKRGSSNTHDLGIEMIEKDRQSA